MRPLAPAFLLAAIAGAALALVADTREARRRSGRWWRAAGAVAGAAALTGLVAAMLRSPRLDWDAARLAHASSLLLRGHFYEAPHGGPVLGTYYGPVGTAYFVPAALVGDPAWGVLAASALSAVAFLAPLVAWLARARGAEGRRALLGAAFVIGALGTPSLSVVSTAVHADAPALALAVLACMIVAGDDAERQRRHRLVCAGALAALAVAAKQTMLPVLLVLPLWLALRGSARSAAAFALAAVTTLVTGALAIGARDGAGTVWFHVVRLVLAFPVDHSLATVRDALTGLLAAVGAPIALLVVRWRAGRAAGERPSLPRASTLFAWAALAASPATLLGVLKYGGNVNSLAPATLLTWYAALAALTAWPMARAKERDAIACVTLALAMLVAAPRAWSMAANARPLSRSVVGLEAAYERAHPDVTWFPMNPLIMATLRARVTHFGPAAYERTVAGDSVGETQWRAYLPTGMRRACWPPGTPVNDPATAWTVRRLGGEPIATADLPGWICVRTDAPRAQLSR